MNLGWYANRLANMSAAEAAHRIAEQAKRAISRGEPRDWGRFEGAERALPIPGLRERFAAGAREALRARIRASADTLLGGEFRIHGMAWPKFAPADLFPAHVWRLDPITGRSWPGAGTYAFDVGHRDARGFGDIKYVWDFNRLQFLQPLAAAFALWGDTSALAAIERAVASWAAANPPFGGLCWNSGIELAVRAVTLVWVVSLCGDALTPETRRAIATILRAHLYWLRRFPSRHSSANNHVIAERLGELVIAAAMPETPGAAGIAADARAAIIHEIHLQILDDGVGAEQSPAYAAFTVEMLLCADLMRRDRTLDLCEAARPRLAAFIEFTRWLCDEKGRAPDIGDDDGGRIFTLFGSVERGYPASVARAAAARLGLPAPVARSADPPELRDGLFDAPPAAPPPPAGLKTFAPGGYTVVRETRAGRSSRLVMDHGALGYLAIAAHGHADANAFTLSLDGVDIFVDPGTHLYHAGGPWRDGFRSTLSHNTLTLGGEDQSLMSGPFNWSRKAAARLEAAQWSPPDWSIEASHDGYVKSWGVEHRRLIRATGQGIAILDRLSGPSRIVAEVSFQLGPDLTIEGGGSEWTIRHAGPALVAHVQFSAPGATSAQAGGAPGQGGWISDGFGHKRASPRLAWRGRLPDEGLLTTIAWNGLFHLPSNT